MTTHELAAKLLELPDLPVALRANGHEYGERHNVSHGRMQAAVFHDQVIIGNMLDMSYRADACRYIEEKNQQPGGK